MNSLVNTTRSNKQADRFSVVIKKCYFEDHPEVTFSAHVYKASSGAHAQLVFAIRSAAELHAYASEIEMRALAAMFTAAADSLAALKQSATAANVKIESMA